jgi:hypothetical protein
MRANSDINATFNSFEEGSAKRQRGRLGEADPVKLVRRVAQTLCVDDLFAHRLVNEYSRFLRVKYECGDFDGGQVVPSAIVDHVWKLELVDTLEYRRRVGCDDDRTFIHRRTGMLLMLLLVVDVVCCLIEMSFVH